jgi:hypothetical protein
VIGRDLGFELHRNILRVDVDIHVRAACRATEYGLYFVAQSQPAQLQDQIVAIADQQFAHKVIRR